VALGSTAIGDVPVVFGASALAPPPVSSVLLPIVDPDGLGFDWAIAPPARPSARIDAAINVAFMMRLLLSSLHRINEEGISSFHKQSGQYLGKAISPDFGQPQESRPA
jgi:hypothetical protein